MRGNVTPEEKKGASAAIDPLTIVEESNNSSSQSGKSCPSVEKHQNQHHNSSKERAIFKEN